ncbi:succinate dehydrogenase cytochrome b556 subunit-like [Anticarsia gemmatalis]|uniref:succinate dehydrogenase cytochrome b556 subunit-like n=1 Tax=Anticarsia gemmatalis TaxID=129554 RepID=UPI003F766A4C
MYFCGCVRVSRCIIEGLQYNRSSLLHIRPCLLNLTSSKKGGGHQITYTDYKKPCYEQHDYKNMKLKRPMSPHLTVYAPNIASMTSIGERISGVVVASYAVLLAFGALFLSNGVETYVSIIQSLNLGFFSTFILKLILGFPWSFHYCNGIRWTAFNSLRWLELPQVRASAMKAVQASIIMTVLFALI